MIAVLGLGYVGLPLAVALAHKGHKVRGFDTNPDVISALSGGLSHVPDVSRDDLLVANQSLTYTIDAADLAGCNTFIICVPTPLSGGVPDTTAISAAVDAIASVLAPGALVVLESTSYPGTTEDLVARPLEAATGLSAGEAFCVAFSPERVDPGNTVFTLANTPKVVAGLRPCCRDAATSVYATVASTLIEASGLREAELSKLLENTYRQVNIALVNELAQVADRLGIDVREAIRCAATKPFGFEAFAPGPGVGGHCIPVDPRFLATHVTETTGTEFRMVELALAINTAMPGYVVQRLTQAMHAQGVSLQGSRIVMLGVAYKADVPDCRETPAAEIVRLLRSHGADISFLDPYVPAWAVDGMPVAPHVAGEQRADACLLITPHSAFRDLDPSTVAHLCLDTRGLLSDWPGVIQL